MLSSLMVNVNYLLDRIYNHPGGGTLGISLSLCVGMCVYVCMQLS